MDQEELNYSYSENYSYTDDYIIMCEVPDSYNKATGICYAIIFCLSILGNLFVLCALIFHEDLKRATNLFMLCLVHFDVLFTLTLPFWSVGLLHHWVFGEFTCKFMTGAYFMGIYGSLLLLTAMTLDRFAVVVVRSYWFTRSRRLRCTKMACVLAWIISFAACLRDALSSKAELEPFDIITCARTHNDEDTIGYYAQLILLFLVPLAIIVFCYTKILLTILSTSSRQKHRTVILVMCIVIAFFTCWGPYHVIIVLMSFYEFDPCLHPRLHMAFIVCRILAFSHCCINPILYMLKGKFWEILSSFLLCSHHLQFSFRGATDPSDSRIHPHTNVRSNENCREEQTQATMLSPL